MLKNKNYSDNGPNAFVREAYALEDDNEMVDFYKKWAENYDHQMLVELKYISPALIAELLHQHLSDSNANILDIGCGTGLSCRLLAEKGYTKLDGIDLSPDMVQVAEQRGIYRELLVGDVNEMIKREDASYDGIISSGTFTHGHVGPEPLDEILRILKPGGIIACTVHLDLWETQGFKSKFEELVNTGSISCLSFHQDKYYEFGEPEGWFCVYQKSN